MAKAISIKVKVSTLISSLQKALADRDARWANQEKEQARYEKDKEAYNLAILKLIKSKGVITEAQPSYGWRGSRNSSKKTVEFSVTMELPTATVPKQPEEPRNYSEHQYERETNEIKQAIRMLSMTEQEFVNASTVKSVSEYL